MENIIEKISNNIKENLLGKEIDIYFPCGHKGSMTMTRFSITQIKNTEK